MKHLFRSVSVLALTAVLVPGRAASAQGVTTGAVLGRVVDAAGSPVAAASVTLVNHSTGQRFLGVSREDGRFYIENVAVGGPYTLGARRIGYRPAEVAGIRVALGQAVTVDLTLEQAATEVAPVTVEAGAENPLTSPARTGAATLISDTAVARLPSLNRNFTDFIALSPQVTSTASNNSVAIGGGQNRLSNIQIDGASDNDLFGLGHTGQPGGQVQAKSITLEALREYQVITAPFDVRQSGFSGGLINAVTKAGTNQYHGSAFWYWQSDRLVGGDTAGVRFGQYLQNQRGLSLGGPIVRDRLQFFTAAEWQQREAPNTGATIGRETPAVVGVAQDSAQRLVNILADSFGVAAGSYGAVTIPSPNKNFFGRLDFQLTPDHVLTVRDNYEEASNLFIGHAQTFYELTSHDFTIADKTNSAVAELNSTLGGGKYYNQARLSLLTIRDSRDPAVPYPEIQITNASNIGGTTYNGTLVVGAERFSQVNRLRQNQLELEDNVTFAHAAHRFTVGTHDERISFYNLFFPTSIGQWTFSSLAALDSGKAATFSRSIPYSDAALGLPGTLQKGVPVADWKVYQVGAFVQDQWSVNDRLLLTGGFRFDVPILPDKPAYNGAADTALGIRTDRIPSGNVLWSPRVGVNWDVTGDRRMVVRGGAGVFSGRPAYVWLSNAYTNTGRETLNIFCTGTNVPAFTTDPNKQPSACAGAGGISAPTAVVNYFPDWFHFPQSFKVDLAVDRELPHGWLGSVEALYTHAIYTIQLQEANLRGVQGYLKDGRPIYGTLPATSSNGLGATPARVSAAFAQVLRHTNGDRDYSYGITAQLQRRFSRGYEVNASYTYSKTRDISSVGSEIATSNFGFNPTGGDPNNPLLATSYYDVPHKIVLSGTVNLPRSSSLTIIYTGNSGSPYTWTYDGDVNADGYPAGNISGRNNDIVYVPRDASDFLAFGATDFVRLDSLINSEPCLREHRGQILPRNSCRNPWVTRLDAKFMHSVNSYDGHHVTLSVDAFNLLNLLNRDWGLTKVVSFNETRSLLRFRGYDAATNQGRFQYIGPSRNTKQSVVDLLSRWRVQVGVRYDL